MRNNPGMATHAFIFNTLIGRGRWLSMSSRPDWSISWVSVPQGYTFETVSNQTTSQTNKLAGKKKKLAFYFQSMLNIFWICCPVNNKELRVKNKQFCFLFVLRCRDFTSKPLYILVKCTTNFAASSAHQFFFNHFTV